MSALSLNEAADEMGWSRRTLTRALKRHGIATIGTGRRARLDQSDLEALKAKERGECSYTHQAPEKATNAGLFVGTTTDSNMRSHLRRLLAQKQRKPRNSIFSNSRVVPLVPK